MSDKIPFSDADLLAYADGAVDDDTSRAIEAVPAAVARARKLAAEMDGFSRQMFRIHCPDTQTLGEWTQALLPPSAAATVADHAATCPHCQAEVTQLRAFMEAQTTREAPAAAGVGVQVRILWARLLGGQATGPALPGLAPAAPGLRGAGPAPLMYEADDDTQITIEIQEDPERPGHSSLLGLVLATREEEWQVRLRGEGHGREAAVAPTGEFELSGLTPGQYQLIIAGHETHIVISRLTV